MSVPRLRLMFDVGRGAGKLIDIPRLLLTHGHLDHSSGLPYYISQRCLRRLPPADIYCPPEIFEPLSKIMRLWSEIEQYEMQYNLQPIDYNRFYELQGNMGFRAIRSIHRVPSNGYCIIQRTKKLKAEFLGLPGHEIQRLKLERDDLFYEAEIPMITFSGDTQIEFVLENELVRSSRVLFMECTYICDRRPTERARRWGHTHLDEIVSNADAFADVEHLFLIHFSTRYKRETILKTLKERLPDWLHERTTAFLTA
ncbi:MAG: MBL fold metallo-hydrolase [Leptospiraceae bacterium]|nr:MBL fold metallo-hydrolase [Leptospiraceae bacterium]